MNSWCLQTGVGQWSAGQIGRGCQITVNLVFRALGILVVNTVWPAIMCQKQTPSVAQLPRAGRCAVCCPRIFSLNRPGRQALFFSSDETRKLRLKGQGTCPGS